MLSFPALLSPPFETVLYVGRAAFLVFSFALAAVAFVRLRRGAERDAQRSAALLARVLERLDAIEARLAESEPKLTALGEQIEGHFGSAAAASRSYAIAIRLARSGAPPEELAQSCGLARHEAELIARLHGRRKEGDARHVALMRA